MSYTELTCKVVKGKKEYRCEWCNENIATEEMHNYRSYIYEGQFSEGRMHPECWTAMSRAPAYELVDGWMPGDYKRGAAK